MQILVIVNADSTILIQSAYIFPGGYDGVLGYVGFPVFREPGIFQAIEMVIGTVDLEVRKSAAVHRCLDCLELLRLGIECQRAAPARGNATHVEREIFGEDRRTYKKQ